MSKTWIQRVVPLIAGSLFMATGCSSDSNGPTQPTAAIQVSVAPSGLTGVNVGTAWEFTARLTNDARNAGVTWTVTGLGCTGAACGTLTVTNDNTVRFTAPATAPSPAAVTLTATSVTDRTRSASATVAITTPGVVTVSISASPGTVVVGRQAQFTATVFTDPADTGVTWTLTGAGCTGATCGTLSGAGSPSGAAVTYTAPAAAPTPATVTITASSITDPSKSASDVFSIIPPVRLSLTPAGMTGVDVRTGRQFAATVSNDPGNLGVTWSVSGSGCFGAACGTLSATRTASGATVTYTAPASVPSPSIVTVKASSVSDPSTSATSTVVVTNPGVVTVVVFPPNASICTTSAPRGSSYGTYRECLTHVRVFTASLFNDPSNAGVTWSWSGGHGSVLPTSSASGVGVTFQATTGSSGSEMVTATSVADPTKSATATVSLWHP